jgi:hypothetical protein
LLAGLGPAQTQCRWTARDVAARRGHLIGAVSVESQTEAKNFPASRHQQADLSSHRRTIAIGGIGR